jgi:putative NIF3 family GTP cyclohydrolase 1 type 2
MSSMTDLSRREFTALAVAAAGLPFVAPRPLVGAALPAQEIVDRIRKNIGVEWKTETVDTLKAGDPSTTITGIVTTSLATLSVLQQAVKAGANLVITSHPTFYARADVRVPAGRGTGRGAVAGQPGSAPPPPPPADPIFTTKNDLITKNNLVVLRLSEHWKLRQPDPMAAGMAATLGWTKLVTPGDPSRVEVPATSLESLADRVKKSLAIRGGMRVVGARDLRVQRVGLLPGSTPIQSALKLLPLVDAIVAGEVREWESVEYARDKAFAGERKALVLIGRVVSEDPGMNACAAWLKTIVPEVPVRHIAAGDPYWRPPS